MIFKVKYNNGILTSFLLDLLFKQKLFYVHYLSIVALQYSSITLNICRI